jgi:DNA-directed RNA polymerase subunit RPC12/RpoP
MRLQLLLTALASWVFLLWVLGLPFFFSKNYFYVGLFFSACAWTVVIAISLLLKCPQCKKNIVFETKQPTPRLSPDWKALRKQFLPIEAVFGKDTVIVCPHCGTYYSVTKGLKSGT